jgi:putative zinc finger/helix-turn-helix YgiT family protein
MIRKCPKCRAEAVHVTRGPYRYESGGLPHVVLLNIESGRCAECGAELVSIPRIAQLHETIAVAFATKPTRLAPLEARFLRKFLGLSTEDLAARMGVVRETVSRWESPRSDKPIGPTSERLLRLLAVRERPVEEYPTDRLADIRDEPSEEPLRLRADEKGWHAEAA